MRSLPTALLSRLTHIDYDRDMAFVLFNDKSELIGVANFAADPDKAKAEYSVVVRSDLKGRGLGTALMKRVVDYAKAFGVAELYGDVFEENTQMLALCKDLGFSVSEAKDGIVLTALKLK